MAYKSISESYYFSFPNHVTASLSKVLLYVFAVLQISGNKKEIHHAVSYLTIEKKRFLKVVYNSGGIRNSHSKYYCSIIVATALFYTKTVFKNVNKQIDRPKYK